MNESKIEKPGTEKKTSSTKPKSIGPTEAITCRSVTSGLLLMTGKKTGLLYRWENYGDTAQVEYQDLLALKYTHSDYLYRPYFVIQDDTVAETALWEDIKGMAEKTYGINNMDTFLSLDGKELQKRLAQMPEGMKSSVAAFAAKKMEGGTLDSLQKIKMLDAVLGTDLLACFKS